MMRMRRVRRIERIGESIGVKSVYQVFELLSVSNHVEDYYVLQVN